MSRQWKPGDVALVTREDGVSFLAHFDDSIWCGLDNPHGAAPHEVTDVRPLVVIDPEDREQVERLALTLRDHKGWCGGVVREATDAMQAALRSLIAPPKPEEPLGLGAVVEDAEGAHWIKVDEHNGCNDWIQKTAGPANRTFYRDIAAVRVLSEGVTE